MKNTYMKILRERRSEWNRMMIDLSHMPPSSHWNRDHEFSYEESEAVRWMVRRVEVWKWIFSMAKNEGVIKFNQETHKWQGISWAAQNGELNEAMLDGISRQGERLSLVGQSKMDLKVFEIIRDSGPIRRSEAVKRIQDTTNCTRVSAYRYVNKSIQSGRLELIDNILYIKALTPTVSPETEGVTIEPTRKIEATSGTISPPNP